MILLLLAGLWLDEALARTATPDWIRAIGYPRETLPPGLVLFVVMAGLCVLASRELARILNDKAIDASRRITTVAAIFGLAVSCLIPRTWDAATGGLIVSSAAVVVLVIALRFYSRHRNTEGVIAAAGGAVLAFVYLGLMFGFVLAIRREHSAWMLAWMLLVVKSCDIGAYFTGRAIGRHKLILWLSPGKTWEGLWGGVVLASVVGAVCLPFVAERESDRLFGSLVIAGALSGLLFGLLGQVGDLLMSLLKRDAGIKDSGRSIPGFGGVLDVLDSPLLVAPVAYWWLRLLLVP
mgnify:CR=1 FL=1